MNKMLKSVIENPCVLQDIPYDFFEGLGVEKTIKFLCRLIFDKKSQENINYVHLFPEELKTIEIYTKLFSKLHEKAKKHNNLGQIIIDVFVEIHKIYNDIKFVEYCVDLYPCVAQLLKEEEINEHIFKSGAKSGYIQNEKLEEKYKNIYTFDFCMEIASCTEDGSGLKKIPSFIMDSFTEEQKQQLYITRVKACKRLWFVPDKYKTFEMYKVVIQYTKIIYGISRLGVFPDNEPIKFTEEQLQELYSYVDDIEHVPFKYRTDKMWIKLYNENANGIIKHNIINNELKNIPEEKLTLELCNEILERNPKSIQFINFAMLNKKYTHEEVVALCEKVIEKPNMGWLISFVPCKKRTAELCKKAMRNGGDIEFVPIGKFSQKDKDEIMQIGFSVFGGNGVKNNKFITGVPEMSYLFVEINENRHVKICKADIVIDDRYKCDSSNIMYVIGKYEFSVHREPIFESEFDHVWFPKDYTSSSNTSILFQCGEDIIFAWTSIMIFNLQPNDRVVKFRAQVGNEDIYPYIEGKNNTYFPVDETHKSCYVSNEFFYDDPLFDRADQFLGNDLLVHQCCDNHKIKNTKFNGNQIVERQELKEKLTSRLVVKKIEI